MFFQIHILTENYTKENNMENLTVISKISRDTKRYYLIQLIRKSTNHILMNFRLKETSIKD
jgi:hypothetical protein